MRFLLLGVFVFLTGCMAGMPNNVSQNISDFDGSRSLTMEPGFIYESADTWSYGHFQLGLFWTSKAKDAVFIKAKLPNGIANIKSHEGLQFNINGKLTKLSTKTMFTKFNTDTAGGHVYADSSKSFAVPITFIQKLLDAKTVKVKLITGNGVYAGDFKADKPSAAIRGFKAFTQKLKQS